MYTFYIVLFVSIFRNKEYMKFCLIGIIIFKLKGRDWLDMVAELKVQFCTEKLYDQFDTIKPFLVYN